MRNTLHLHVYLIWFTDVSSPDDSSLYRQQNGISLFIRSWIYEIILG